jgi:hypothetical protein
VEVDHKATILKKRNNPDTCCLKDGQKKEPWFREVAILDSGRDHRVSLSAILDKRSGHFGVQDAVFFV